MSCSSRSTMTSSELFAAFASASNSAGVAVNAGLSNAGAAFATLASTPNPRNTPNSRLRMGGHSSSERDPKRVMNSLVAKVGRQCRVCLVDYLCARVSPRQLEAPQVGREPDHLRRHGCDV